MSNETTDLALVASTAHGRRFLLRLLRHTGCDTQVFTGDSAHDTFSAGRQSVGLTLKGWIQSASFEDYIRMLQEDHEDARRHNKRD